MSEIMKTPELRQDPVSKRWIIFQNFELPVARRFQYHINTDINFSKQDRGEIQKNVACPYCPGNEHLTPDEVLAFRSPGHATNGPDWWVRVFPEAQEFLSLTIEPDRTGVGIFDRMNGYGAHEIVVEHPLHLQDTFTGDLYHIKEALFAYQQRLKFYKENEHIKYVTFNRNFGQLASPAISHAHGHVFATPIFSKRINNELNNAREHFLLRERCLFCDIIDQELSNESRIVAQNDYFLAFIPFAARFPFEITLIPRHHDLDFEKISPDVVDELSSVIKMVIGLYRRVLDSPSYIFVLHNGPNQKCRKIDTYWDTINQDYHWHFEIMPILIPVAAFEVGTGIYINPVFPEEAAATLLANRSIFTGDV